VRGNASGNAELLTRIFAGYGFAASSSLATEIKKQQ
jgi:hypothetical protein